MSFFDSKEEVLNIELTQIGKYLLSKGLFSPKYYSFFDDDIIYDSEYIGIQEKQNSSQERILNETPYLKPQSNFSSLVKKTERIENTIGDGSDEIRQVGISTNISTYPLGTSDYNSEYAPAWNIKILSGQILDYSPNIQDSTSSNSTYTFLEIPQINMKNAEFNLLTLKRDDEKTINKSQNEVYITMPEDSNFDVYSSDQNLTNIIEVIEKNCQDNNKNFDIEVFIEEEDKWKQLYFFKDIINIKDDILLDEYLNKEVASSTLDESCVEYYLEVLFDNNTQIPAKLKQSMSEVYSSPVTDEFKPFGDKC